MTLTAGKFLEIAAQHFAEAKLYYGHGTDNPWDEAVALLRYVLNLPIDSDRSVLARMLTAIEQTTLEKLVERRTTEHIPVAYLTNEAWFAGLKFFVNQHVLIPRSPLAELIINRFSPWISNAQKIKYVLDIGTGSGCLAVAIAHYFPNAQVDAVDIDQKALEVAAVNINNHHFTDRIYCVQSDVFKKLKNNKKYDVIITNPPYINKTRKYQLPKEYHHEPDVALYSEQKGLAHIATILNQSKNFLSQNGLLIAEVGEAKDSIIKAYPQLPFMWVDLTQGGEGVFILEYADLINI